ncbi:MAG: sensor domain-containing diguanylate cyclase [Deltaproteobacteria bacterium]|nr:sensor domain-containing diguanylate cyclase [Deltaproteobacteria bacterium]
MHQSDSFVTRDVLDSLHEGLYVTDPEQRITFWNKGAERITGFSAHEVMGKQCEDNILMHVNEAGERLCEGLCPLAETLSDGRFREQDLYLQHKDGHRVPVKVRVSPLRDGRGQVTGAVEVFYDNSWQVQTLRRIKELEELAMLDSLTQLPNRHFINELLQSRLAEFDRVGWIFGLLFMDLDNFKWINDHLGHGTGDEALVSVGKTLSNVSRPYDVVGRWGGDEFVGLVTNANFETLTRLAERYRALVGSTQLKRGSQEARITISIGGTLVRAGDDAEKILARADGNQYRAKRAGRDRAVIG